MPDLTDPLSITFIVGAIVALAVVGGVVGFALWYVGDDRTEL